MNTRKHIQDELESLKSNLPCHIGGPVFNVPQGYFDNFASSVLAKIKERNFSSIEEMKELSPMLASIKKEMPYSLPENYFSALQTDVPLLIRDKELPALLANHHKSMPYELPADYFASLPNSVLSKINKPVAKVISIKRNNWMKIAVAAMVAGIIGVSGIFYFNDKSPAIDPAIHQAQWVEKNLEGISDQTLDEFIKTADYSASENMAKTSNHTTEVRSMLNEISDTELDAFLAAVPTDDDELSVIN